jgi:p-hydroxybenzoate 3-monooxygenase
MRSPEVSRLYLQVRNDEDIAAWPEHRIWAELRLRLGEPSLPSGEIIDIGITPMRSAVLEPMQCGRMFVAGDAAHIVPPTGAKGMNLALADVAVLSPAMVDWFRTGSTASLDQYSQNCARRVWRAQRFSAFMTNLLHRDAEGDPFQHRLRLANLEYTVGSRAAATSLAENYVGAATDGVAL